MVQQRSVISVGNFDGVHRGHQALLRVARQLADPRGARVVALTFPQNPLTLLRPDCAPPKLMDTDARQAALLAAGADEVHWLAPLPDILQLTAEQFVQQVVERFAPLAWLEGPDFRFGHGRAGDALLLARLGAEKGFESRVIEPIEITLRDKTRITVRSSLIRWLLSMGRVADAQLCLGRPYSMRGTVIRGEQRGRELGFPTANLDTGDLLLPADGVYAGTVEIRGLTHTAAISIGTKPHFHADPAPRTAEAHVLDFDGDLYGQTLDVQILRWIREQRILPSLESLIAQIRRDVGEVRSLHTLNILDPVAGVIAEDSMPLSR